MATAKQQEKRSGLSKKIFRVLSPSLAIAVTAISLFLIGPGTLHAVTRAQTLHEICKQALQTPGATIVTDLDTECV